MLTFRWLQQAEQSGCPVIVNMTELVAHLFFTHLEFVYSDSALGAVLRGCSWKGDFLISYCLILQGSLGSFHEVVFEWAAWARLLKRAVKTRLSCSAALRGNIAHTWDVLLGSYCLNAVSEIKKLFHHLVTSKSYSSKVWWAISLFSNVWTVQ